MNQTNPYSKICQLLKVFNDATNTLSGVCYLTTNLFIIETLNIIGAFDECVSQESELKTCIEVMKSKRLDYYANIPLIYLLRLVFGLCCKLDSLSICLKNYYNYLELEVDILSIVSNVKSIFFLLYDEYVKFYDPNLNVNIQQDVPPSTRIDKGYQLLFQTTKKNTRFLIINIKLNL